MLFLGRPLRFFSGISVSTSAAFNATAPAPDPREFERIFLCGAPFGFGLSSTLVSDFLGRPRGRLTGECESGSLRGTVVVLVRVTRLTDGDIVFSSSLPGSAWTVTLMRQGLAPVARGVLRTIDLAGDSKPNSDMFMVRFCLLGDFLVRGVWPAALRVSLVVLSSADMASGSGLES